MKVARTVWILTKSARWWIVRDGELTPGEVSEDGKTAKAEEGKTFDPDLKVLVRGASSGLTRDGLKAHYIKLANADNNDDFKKTIEDAIDTLFSVIQVKDGVITIGEYDSEEITKVYTLLKEDAVNTEPYRVTILYSGEDVDRAFKIAISNDGNLKIEKVTK